MEVDNTQIERYSENYSQDKLWEKLKRYSKQAGCKVVYIVLLLYYVLVGGEVSLRDKSLIIGTLGYFILPFDLLPDMIPFGGYGDDLAVLLWALHKVSSSITPAMKEKAVLQLREWFGDFDKKEIQI